MGWRTIQIDEASQLKLYLDNLLIYKDNHKISIELASIDTIIIDNYKLNISLQLINKLSEFNIFLFLCDNKHIPVTQILPISGHNNSLKIMQAQCNWATKDKGKCWQKIVKNKILNQMMVLKQLSFDFKELKIAINNVEEFDITNREGFASKFYWRNLFGENFTRKDDNFINLYLNYGYAILRGYLARAIIKKGLDPRLSIFHKSYDNFYALASDLMEPFRPIVDYQVYKMVYDKSETVLFGEAKDRLIKTFCEIKLLSNGKLEFFNNAVDNYVDSIVNNLQVDEILIPYDQF